MKKNRWFALFCQWLVGASFVFSGLSKAIDPVGTSIKIGEYLQHFSFGLLADFTLAMAWGLALVEFSMGFYILIGRHRLLTASMSMLFMAVMTPLTLYLAIFNPVDDCGCFGDVLVLSNWQTFWKNVVLTAAIVCLFLLRYRQVSMLSRIFHTFYFYTALFGVLLLLALGTWRLPFVDFRPFRPGVDLAAPCREVMSDAIADENAQYIVVYEKDGQRQEFSLDNLPDEADGWTFVETIMPESRVAVSESGHENLVLFDESGDDVTCRILSDTGYVMLLLSPDLNRAEEHDIDRIENLYEYALEQGYPFYCITERNPDAVARWHFNTGAEYPYLYADRQIVETMIRSNPGFMLLHNGIILWKSHLPGVDVAQMTSAKLSEQSLGQIRPISRKKRVFWIAVWLVAPMLLYLPLRIIKTFSKKKQK